MAYFRHMVDQKSSNLSLFAIPVVIWGSTWYVITFQLGEVDPLLSVSYRFLIGSALLIIFCLVTKRPLKLSRNAHLRIALQGALLFGFNYWLVYQSEELINSGLVAIGFSTIIFFNIIFGALILKRKIVFKVLSGAILGLMGTVIIFNSELSNFEMGDDGLKGILLCVLSVAIASLGNITSAKNSELKIPVVQATAYGMAYGGLIMFIIALALGKTVTFDISSEYVLSLIYLIIFGSVIAFSTYLTLISRIGPDRAAYAIVLVPLVAVTISTILEGFEFTILTGLGMLLLLAGNYFALRPKTKKVTNQ